VRGKTGGIASLFLQTKENAMPVVALEPGKSIALRATNKFRYTVHNPSQSEEGAYSVVLSDPPLAVTHDIAPHGRHKFMIDREGAALENRGRTELTVFAPGE
jgi:hypothetical protein